MIGSVAFLGISKLLKLSCFSTTDWHQNQHSRFFLPSYSYSFSLVLKVLSIAGNDSVASDDNDVSTCGSVEFKILKPLLLLRVLQCVVVVIFLWRLWCYQILIWNLCFFIQTNIFSKLKFIFVYWIFESWQKYYAFFLILKDQFFCEFLLS